MISYWLQFGGGIALAAGVDGKNILIAILVILLSVAIVWIYKLRFSLGRGLAAITSNEKRIRDLGDHIPDAILFQINIDRAKKIHPTYISAKAKDILDISPEDIISEPRRFYDAIHDEDTDMLVKEVKKAINTRDVLCVECRIALNGKVKWLFIRACQLYEINGELAWGGFCLDITEQKESEQERQEIEEKMLHQSKLATLGEIAAGIAHEINQPLTYLKGTLQLAVIQMEEGRLKLDETKESFQKGLSRIDHIHQIISHLKNFGRSDLEDFKPVNLENVLDESLILMSEKIRLRNIKLKKKIQDNLPWILGNANQMEQVFLNFFQNSIDSIGKRKIGVIEIRMRHDNNLVIVEFSDNGDGIAPENIGKIFESFYTTKELGKGTGLGLSIVKSIIDRHEATIKCESVEEVRTTFTIEFPAGKHFKLGEESF